MNWLPNRRRARLVDELMAEAHSYTQQAEEADGDGKIRPLLSVSLMLRIKSVMCLTIAEKIKKL